MTAAATLAVSDLLVMQALERASARVLPRSARGHGVDPSQRYRLHERCAVAEAQIDRALAGAWALCPLLASRHQLPVDVALWVATLDDYTRSLLLMSAPHSTSQLVAVVDPIVIDVAHSALHVVS